jgi:hypothetical protein
LVVSVALFSLCLALFLWSARSAKMWFIFPIFRVTMMAALPIWLVYLPVVIAVKNPEGRKIWSLLLSGSPVRSHGGLFVVSYPSTERL